MAVVTAFCHAICALILRLGTRWGLSDPVNRFGVIAGGHWNLVFNCHEERLPGATDRE